MPPPAKTFADVAPEMGDMLPDLTDAEQCVILLAKIAKDLARPAYIVIEAMPDEVLVIYSAGGRRIEMRERTQPKGD